MKGLHQYATRAVDDAIAQRLLGCLTCIEADPKDPASFDAMSKQLDELEAAQQTGGNRLFYLATPPNAFLPISRELGRTGLLAENGSWRRLVIEKPFGTDLASAKALNSELLKLVDEHQIYRIDHYLGKETVQNILVLRFANGMFEPIWNRNHIDHIQITVGKALGVKRTEIAIKFKQAPFAMFRDTPVDRLSQNYLIISTEPTEGIALQFNTKVPGPNINIDGVEMKFRYKDYFKTEPSTGYETLIYDCMIGDNILFQRADSVEAGWQAVQPFLDAWKKAGAKGLKVYEPGSEGPEEANELVERDGRSWRKLG